MGERLEVIHREQCKLDSSPLFAPVAHMRLDIQAIAVAPA